MADTSSRVPWPQPMPQTLQWPATALAAAYQAAGQREDRSPCTVLSLARTERMLGPGHPDTLTVRAELAQACLEAGQLTDAIPHFERTLAGREWVFGPDHPADADRAR